MCLIMKRIKINLLVLFNNLLIKSGFLNLFPKIPTHEDKTAYAFWRMQSVKDEISIMSKLGINITDKVVLDFGCGEGGKLLELYKLNPKKLYGVDINEDELQYARSLIFNKIGGKINVEIKKCNHNTIPIPDSSIDIIICISVLEHVSDINSVAKEWFRILKDNGKVFIKFQPFESPYGHHAIRILGIPWCHCFLSSDELKLLVDKVRLQHKKITNKDLLPNLPYINRLKLNDIISVILNNGFKLEHYFLIKLMGKTHKWSNYIARLLFIFPTFRPYFSSVLISVLRKNLN